MGTLEKMDYICNFLKTAQSKQSPIWRKYWANLVTLLCGHTLKRDIRRFKEATLTDISPRDKESRYLRFFCLKAISSQARNMWPVLTQGEMLAPSDEVDP
jgi:hypothetical protein